MKKRLFVTSVIVVLASVFGGSAASAHLTVTTPKGKQPVVDQPDGNADNTPALGNPSGVAVIH